MKFKIGGKVKTSDYKKYLGYPWISIVSIEDKVLKASNGLYSIKVKTDNILAYKD